jgi:hypothetical protein
MSKAGRMKATKVKKAKRSRGITVARSGGLCAHVLSSIRRVASRPRFGFEIVDSVKSGHPLTGFTIKYCGDEYKVFVSAYERECNITVVKDTIKHDDLFAFNDHRIYYKQFPIDELPDMKSIGTVISNLVYNHPVWLLTKE